MPNKKFMLPLGAIGSGSERVSIASKGQPLRQPDSDDNEIIFVKSGILGLFIMDTRKNRQIVGLRFPGEMIVPGSRGRAGIWPLTTAEVVIGDLVPDMLTLDEEVLVLRQQRRDAIIAQEWLAKTRAPASERLAHLFCEIATRGGYGTERMPNALTQLQLADISGQTSVNVNRIIHDLERQGLIERVRKDGKHEIVFRDWEGLCRLAGFQPDYLDTDARELEAA